MRPSLLTWLATSLSAGLPRWSLLLSYHSRASSTSGTVSLAACPWSFSRSLSLKLAGSRFATYNLATALLSARGRHSLHLAAELLSARGRGINKIWTLLRVIVWVICASHGRALQLQNGVLCNLDTFLKLFDITSTRRSQDVLIPSGDVAHELEMQLRLVFALKSHSPRAIERQCLYPKVIAILLLVTSPVQTRSFTILFALIVWWRLCSNTFILVRELTYRSRS